MVIPPEEGGLKEAREKNYYHQKLCAMINYSIPTQEDVCM